MSNFVAARAKLFSTEIEYRISSGKMLEASNTTQFRKGLRGKSKGRRGGQIWRVAQGSRAAMFKKIRNAGCHDPKQLAGQLAYVNGKSKAVFGCGFAHDGTQATLEARAVSDLIDTWSEGWKGATKNGHTSHLVLSFPDDVTDAQAAAIAEDWCAQMFEERTHVDDTWQYFAALHTDTTHPHVHVVVNNRGDEGCWFYMAEKHAFNYDVMREAIVDIADEHGVFLDSATRLERGKLTYPAPSHVYQEAKRLGLEVIERPMAPGALELAQAMVERHAHDAEVMAGMCTVMEMPALRDVLTEAAADLREATSILPGANLNEEQLAQHSPDIRDAIVNWSSQNAERIAKAVPAKRDRFVKAWVKVIDLIDKIMDPEADITFASSMGKKPNSEPYGGSFVKAAIGDEERLMTVTEGYLESRADVKEMRAFVATGKFTEYLLSGDHKTEDEDMLNAIGAAFEDITNGEITDVTDRLDRIKKRAAKAGLDPEAYEQRIIAGAHDRRMEREWMVQDLRRVGAHHGIDIGKGKGADKALAIVYKVHDYVEKSTRKMHDNHLTFEPTIQPQPVIPAYERDHTAFVARSKGTISMMRVFKTAVFDTKGHELAFLEDFKQEFGEEGINRLAAGDLDIIKDLAAKEQERRDIAYVTLRLMKRNPSLGVDVHDIDAGMERYNPSIWHGQGGHSI